MMQVSDFPAKLKAAASESLQDFFAKGSWEEQKNHYEALALDKATSRQEEVSRGNRERDSAPAVAPRRTIGKPADGPVSTLRIPIKRPSPSNPQHMIYLLLYISTQRLVWPDISTDRYVMVSYCRAPAVE